MSSSIFILTSLQPFSFGKRLNLLEAERSLEITPDSASVAFSHAFDFAQNHLSWRIAMVNVWQVIERFVPSLGTPMKEACKTLDDYVYELIDARQREKAPDECEDLLQLFMTAGNAIMSPMGRTELKDAAMNMLIAGRSVHKLIDHIRSCFLR